MDDCLFCKIAAKKVPAAIIYEDDHAVAFLDIMPRALGHTMVIPKTHARTLVELPDAEVGPLFLAVKRVAELISRKLLPDGITIGMNQGRASGQEVDHLHVHLIPRTHGDKGSSVQSVVNSAPKESIEEVRKKIVG